MRLNLYWRGIDLIDIEVHVMRPRDQGCDHGDGPTLQASDGGQFELADEMESPDTSVRIGFR